MKKLLAFFLTNFLVCGWASAALANQVELGPIGNEGPNFVWCIKGQHKVKPRQAFFVTFRGRSTLPQGDTGRVILVDESIAHFEWQERLDADPDESPIFRFGPAMGLLTSSDPRGLFTRTGVPAGLYFIEFAAVDSTTAINPRIRGCLVEVVNQLPDVEVVDVRWDTPAPNASGRVVRVSVRNNMVAPATALLSVPWSISLTTNSGGALEQTRVLASGVRNYVAPGSTFEVTGTFTIPRAALTGLIQVTGSVNQGNVIGENDAELANNAKTIGGPPPFPTPPTPLVTRELDYKSAQMSGATFNDVVVSGFGCTAIGVGDWKGAWAPHAGQKPGVIFRVACPAGGETRSDAYGNFRLQNGWRVKSIDDPSFVVRTSTSRTGFEFTTKPVVGSNDPFMVVHVWGGPATHISAGVRVFIEGPAGTDPYVAGGVCQPGCSLQNSICVTPDSGGGRTFACTIHQDCDAQHACGTGGTCVRVCGR